MCAPAAPTPATCCCSSCRCCFLCFVTAFCTLMPSLLHLVLLAGFYAYPELMQPCEQCPPGKTTLYVPGDGTLQDSIDDCFPEEGAGLFSANASNPWTPGNASSLAAAPCPVGCFGQAPGSSARTTLCQACPYHSSSKTAGSSICDGEWQTSCCCY